MGSLQKERIEKHSRYTTPDCLDELKNSDGRSAKRKKEEETSYYAAPDYLGELRNSGGQSAEKEPWNRKP